MRVRVHWCLALLLAASVVWVFSVHAAFRLSTIALLPANFVGQQSDPKLNRQSKLANKPDLTLTKGHSMTLAMHVVSEPHLVNNLYCILLRSVVPFWPAKFGRIGLIMDEESPRDHSLASKLKDQEEALGVQFDIKYQPLPENPEMLIRGFKQSRGPGYHRQMWNTYFLDVYISTSIIAYTDTDVMFSTPVTPEDIFNGDKLRVYVATKWTNSRRVVAEDKATYTAIGKKMIGKCDPFPTYLWRDTVTNCRNYILKHLNVSRFEDAFRKIHVEHLVANPIKLIITYAYYFEHDRYDWHFEIQAKLLGRYNKVHLSPGFYIQPEDTLPTFIVSTHKPTIERGSPFKLGYCMAMRRIGPLPAWCGAFRTSTDFHLFTVETGREVQPTRNGWCHGTVGRALCTEMSERHYRDVAKYYRMGLYDFNLDKVSAVEKVAAQMNITCAPLMKPPFWRSEMNTSTGDI